MDTPFKEGRSLKPNDVAIVLRPHIEDGIYQGSFGVFISCFGPLVISKDDTDNLLGMAMMLASVIPHMEKDEELADKIAKFCGEVFKDEGEFSYNPKHDSFDEGILTINTITVGGTQ